MHDSTHAPLEQWTAPEDETGAGGCAGEHQHEIYLVGWDGRLLHVHHYRGVTSFDLGHRHRYAGTTAPAPSGVQHTHLYEAETTLDDRHTHFIRGRTGPAIPLPGGGHYHLIVGVTTVGGATPHRHSYSGRTSAAGGAAADRDG